MKTNCRLIHYCLYALLLIAALVALPAAVRAEENSDSVGGEHSDYVRDEIVVKLFSAADLPAVVADYDLDENVRDQFGSRPIYVLGTKSADAQDKADEISGDSRVEYVEPNQRYSAPEGQKRSSWARVEDVTDYAAQWAADKIRLPAAHGIARGRGVIVAILDTGVDASHPALVGKLLPGYDFVDMDSDPSEVGIAEQDPTYGHGTHVAGIVALTAPDAKILPIRVLDPNGEGNVWVLAEALSYAVNPDGDPATDDGATVINLSLSTSQRTAFLDDIIDLVTCPANDDDDEDDDDGGAIDGGSGGHVQDRGMIAVRRHDDDCLSSRGAVIVAAAGNNGSTKREYPAAEDSKGLVAVAATTEADMRAAYSNYGSWVALGAPGDAILSCVPGNYWSAWSGTSMAAPFVSGTVALVQSANPQLAPDLVIRRITGTAHQIGSEVRLRLDAAAALGAPPAPETNAVLFLPLLQTGPQ